MSAFLVSHVRPAHRAVRSRIVPKVARFKAFVPVDTRSAEFVAMLPVFRATGGMVTGEEVCALYERRRPDAMSDLARRIATGELVSFEWHASRWLPMFQFDPQTMDMADGPRAVVRELGGFMDGWEITKWFAAPHPALGGMLPLDVLATDLPGTIDAARLDRFIACG